MRTEQGAVGSWAVPAYGAVATKAITRNLDGSEAQQDFSAGRFWRFTRFNLSGIDALADELARRIHDPSIALVYATLRDGLDPAGFYRRLLRDQPDAPATLEGGRRSWLAGDVDKVAVPDGLDKPENWKEAAAYVRANLLPPALQNVRMATCPSSSTGRKEGVTSCRYFAELETAEELSAIHSWAVGAQRAGYAVDPAVTVPNQLIYFARPRFIGMSDPLLAAGDLVFVLDGEDKAKIDFTEFAEANVAHEVRVRETLAAIGGTWRDKLAATLGGFEGYHEPIKRACRAAVGAGVSEAEWTQVAADLLNAAAAGLPVMERMERLHKYGPAELARMHRDFCRYEIQLNTHNDRTLQALGL